MTADQTPPNDTGAPDTSREAEEHAAFEAWWPTEWPNAGTVSDQVWKGWKGRASLSAAREAAAALEMREAAEREFPGPAYGGELVRRRISALPLPDTAALDRLIAERVREAVEAERERIAGELDYEASLIPCAEDASVMLGAAMLVRANFSHDRAEAMERARGSKEGRDG